MTHSEENRKTTVRVSVKTRRELYNRKNVGDSMDDVISRLLKEASEG